MHKGRQHIIKLFGYTTKYFWLLIIPVLRSLHTIFKEGADLMEWLEGAYLDLLVLGVIFGFAFFSEVAPVTAAVNFSCSCSRA